MAKLQRAPSLTQAGTDPRTGLSALIARLSHLFAEISTSVNLLYDRIGPDVPSGPLATYTVATVPSAAEHVRKLIYVSDETGGPTVAFSDGTNWLRVQDRAVVS